MRIRFVMSSAKEYDECNKRLGKRQRASKNVWLSGFVGWDKGYKQLRNRTVFVGLSEVRAASRDMRISFVRLLNRVIDHELGHAFTLKWKSGNDSEEEAFMRRFELAGDWTRRE